jgi:hypothetical protein
MIIQYGDRSRDQPRRPRIGSAGAGTHAGAAGRLIAMPWDQSAAQRARDWLTDEGAPGDQIAGRVDVLVDADADAADEAVRVLHRAAGPAAC